MAQTMLDSVIGTLTKDGYEVTRTTEHGVRLVKSVQGAWGPALRGVWLKSESGGVITLSSGAQVWEEKDPKGAAVVDAVRDMLEADLAEPARIVGTDENRCSFEDGRRKVEKVIREHKERSRAAAQ